MEHQWWTLVEGTPSQCQRHALARNGFWRLFSQDTRVLSLYAKWDTESGASEVISAAERAAKAWASFESYLGIPPGQFWEYLSQGREVVETVLDAHPDFQQPLIAWLEAHTIWKEACGRVAVDGAALQEALHFVLGLRLPWPWVAADLFERWARRLPLKRLKPQEYRFIVQKPEAPLISHLFETRAGETLDDAIERLTTEFRQVTATLEQARGVDSGRMPRDSRTIERNVQWLYRVRIKAPSDTRYRLAQEYWASKGKPGKVDDSIVAAGIKQAHELLSLCPYGWDIIGPGKIAAPAPLPGNLAAPPLDPR